MILGILPYIKILSKKNLDANSGINVFLCSGRLKISSAKKPKRNGDTSAVAIFKDARQSGLRISGYRAAEIITDFSEEHKILETNSTSASLKSLTASDKHSRKVHRLV